MNTSMVRLILSLALFGVTVPAYARQKHIEVEMLNDDSRSGTRSLTHIPRVWFNAELGQISALLFPSPKTHETYTLTVRHENGTTAGSVVLTANGPLCICPLTTMQPGLYTVELIGTNTYSGSFHYTPTTR